MTAKLFFEVSWEVCNKVGGIYTVVSSKAPTMMKKYEQYYLIGPYYPEKARGIFEERAPPEKCKGCFEALKKEGIEVHMGKWLVKGSPHAILIDYSQFGKNVNEIKKELWERYQLDTLHTQYHDFDEPIVWGWAVGKVIEKLTKVLGATTVAQFHEWLSGSAMLYLQSKQIPLGTVFTTHATLLGRTLATRHVNIYDLHINAEEEARNSGPSVWAKFQMERICAREADVFTTVSSITALEAEKFLGKKPDILLPNGLDIEKFPTLEEASILHRVFKQRAQLFLMYHFFPYYQFDLKNTLLYFIAGRYEFRDKGIDIFIKSLGELNKKLKEEKCEKTIVAFFFIPSGVKSIHPDLLENKTNFIDIKDSIDDSKESIINELTYLLVSGKRLSTDALFNKDILHELNIKISRLKRKGTPPLTTHELYDNKQDPILSALKQQNLTNNPDDKVKVVFYPIYLTGADGLLDTTYYESLSAGHLGVFPSFYEPWGYTPLETSARGVSAITTNVSGFGAYVEKHIKKQKYPGIFIIDRMNKNEQTVIGQLSKVLYDFAHFSKHERVENKISARRLAEKADWASFGENYFKAHNMALKKKGL